MTLRAEIRGVLAAGRKNAQQILDLCEDAKNLKRLVQNLSVLKGEGKIKRIVIDNISFYEIAKWPERESDTAPHQKRGKKAKRARAAEVPAAAPANGQGRDEFSITDSGVLAIKQGESVIHLRPESFTRLRTFVERAEAIFNATE
jgi:hypothetical protein